MFSMRKCVSFAAVILIIQALHIGTAQAEVPSLTFSRIGLIAAEAALGGCPMGPVCDDNRDNDDLNFREGPCPPEDNIGSTAGETFHVVIATGNVYTDVPVLKAYGAGEVSLDLTLTYNSLLSNEDIGLGYGWTHSYDYRYYDVPGSSFEICHLSDPVDGHCIDWSCGIAMPDRVVLVDGDGRRNSYYAKHITSLWQTCAELPPWTGYFDNPPGRDGILVTSARADETCEANEEFQLQFPDGRRWYYGLGRIKRMVSARGLTTQFSYDFSEPNNPRLLTVTDGYGRTITFEWMGSHIDKIIHPDSAAGNHVETLLFYDPEGRLQVISDPLGKTIEYDYETLEVPGTDFQRITREKLKNGVVNKCVYSSNERTIYSCTDCLDPSDTQTLKVTSPDRAFPVRRSDPLDNGDDDFDDVFNLYVVDEQQVQWHYLRDEFGRLVHKNSIAGIPGPEYISDSAYLDHFDGGARAHSYRRIAWTDHPTGLRETIDWGPAGSPPGLIHKRTLAPSNELTPSFSYTTEYKYENLNQKLIGLPTKEIQPDGGEWEYQYNNRGDLTAIIDPDEHVQSFDYEYYDDNLSYPGRLKKVTATDRNGYQIIREYNGVGDLVLERVQFEANPNKWIETEYVSDIMGRRILQTVYRGDAQGTAHVTKYTYDAMGQHTSTIESFVPGAEQTDNQNLTTSYAYDGHGLLLSETNPRGVITEYAYDHLNRLASVNEDAGMPSSHLNLSTTIQWGAELEWQPGVVSTVLVTDPKLRTTEYVLDAKKRPFEVRDAAGYRTRYVRHESGKIKELRRQRTITDDLNSPSTKVYVATYDQLGRILTRNNFDGFTTHFEYNHPSQPGGSSCGCGGLGSAIPYKVWEDTITPAATTYRQVDKLGRLTKVIRKVADTSETPDADDAVTTYTYDPEGGLIQVVGPEQETVNRTYDGAGRLKSRTVVPGGTSANLVTTYFYDGVDNVTKVINPTLHEVEYQYDSADRLARVFDSSGDIATYSYDKNGNIKTRGNGEGATWEYEYDVLDRIVIAKDPIVEAGLDRVISYTYDDVDNLVETRNRNNVVTRHEYDDIDRLFRVIEDYDPTVPNFDPENFCYGADGQQDLDVEGEGGTQGGGIIQVPGGGGGGGGSGSGGGTRTTGITPTQNSAITYVYDGRYLTEIVDPDCNKTTYTYDTAGRVTEVRYPDNCSNCGDSCGTGECYGAHAQRVFRFRYNSSNQRKLDREMPLTTNTNQVKKTTYVFDELDRLSHREYRSNNVLKRKELFYYNRSSRLVQADANTDANESTPSGGNGIEFSWMRGYDQAGRPVLESQIFNGDPSAQLDTFVDYALNPSAHVISQQICYPDCGDEIVERVWDGRGRFVGSGIDATIGVDWSYDASDRRSLGIRRTNQNELSFFEYDANDRMTSFSHLVQAIPGSEGFSIGQSHSYGYDPEGNRTWTIKEVPEADWVRSETYGSDNRNRLKEFKRGLPTFENNGDVTIAEADYFEHPTLAAHQQWVDLDRRGNWLDYREQNKVGGILKPRRETRERNGVNQNVFVDADDPVTPPNPDTTVGNLAVKYDFAGNVTFDPLARLGGVAPDLGSEFAFGPGLEFAYDLENRVTSIHRDTNNGQSNVNDPTGEPKVMAFAYDALGRRVEATEYVDAATGELMDGASGHANPRKTRHVYFGLETIQEYACGADGSAANLPDEWACSMGMPLVREFVWGDPDRFPEVVAMIRHNPDTQDEFVYHYLHDILGSVIGLVDFEGDLVERYTYDPYGKVFIERWDEAANEGQGDWVATAEAGSGLPYSSFRNPWMWTGHRYDAAVGLCHTLFRTYSPTLGRWLQRDPIEYFAGSISLYEYVGSGPLNATDPSGLIIDTIWDIGNVIYDAGRAVKNTAEIGYEGARYAYHYVSDNPEGMEDAKRELKKDSCQLGEAALDGALDVGATLIPCVPAGVSKIAREGTEFVIKHADDVNDAKKVAGLGDDAAEKAAAGAAKSCETKVKHHKIPSQELKKMPPSIRKKAKGRKGRPNRVKVDEKWHKDVHKSIPGSRGGRYNKRAAELIDDLFSRKSVENITEDDFEQIAEQLMREMGG